MEARHIVRKFKLPLELGLLTLMFLVSGCGEQSSTGNDGFTGSGKNGAPTSLEEHALLACYDYLGEVKNRIDESLGQERDILEEQWSKVSESTVCGCAAKVGEFPEFYVDLNMRGQAIGPWLVDFKPLHAPWGKKDAYAKGSYLQEWTFNSDLNENRESGQLAHMYQTFRNYSLEEAIDQIRLVYSLVQGRLERNAELCLSGFNPAGGRVRSKVDAGGTQVGDWRYWEYDFQREQN
jgi:hypothetical protein